MSAFKFNPMTPNNEIGIYFVKSRPVVIDIPFGEMATWIKIGTAGTIVWYNSELDETSVIVAELGEILPLVCDQILSSATIDGTPYTTTSSGMYWVSTSQQLKKL